MNLLDVLFDLMGPKKTKAEPVASAVVHNEGLQSAVINQNPSNLDLIPILPTTTHADLMSFIAKEKTVVFRYFYKRLREAVLHNQPEVILFRIADSKMVIFFEKSQYEEVLRAMLDHFMKVEEYEMVPRCRKVLEKFYVNKVIDESR